MDIQAAFEKQFGALTDTVNDLPRRFVEQSRIGQYERLRTRKMVRIPVISGTAVAGALSFGGDTSVIRCGPDQGYVWSLGLLAIEGLSASPLDTVQIFRNSNTGQGRLIWQLTGSQPVSTFGKGQQILKPGESLLVVSVGTFTSTVECTLSGMAREVAAELEGEFF